MSRDWVSCLEDIAESGARIASYTQELSLEEFRGNQLVFDAVVRNLEIIGDAARHLPDSVTAGLPEGAWARTVAFRDVIARHYFGLDARIVWDLVQSKIPEIVRAAGAALEAARRQPEQLR
ncbi:MAG: DUF86 domain-containing protein [Gammaproteobacteria bacterium]